MYWQCKFYCHSIILVTSLILLNFFLQVSMILKCNLEPPQLNCIYLYFQQHIRFFSLYNRKYNRSLKPWSMAPLTFCAENLFKSHLPKSKSNNPLWNYSQINHFTCHSIICNPLKFDEFKAKQFRLKLSFEYTFFEPHHSPWKCNAPKENPTHTQKKKENQKEKETFDSRIKW